MGLDDDFDSMDDWRDLQDRFDRSEKDRLEEELRRRNISPTPPIARPVIPSGETFLGLDDERDIATYEAQQRLKELDARITAYDRAEHQATTPSFEAAAKPVETPTPRRMPTIEETIALIKLLHENQTDQDGQPYWQHPVAVMNLLPEGTDLEVKLAALLHDVLEDTPTTRLYLVCTGYSERTIAAVEAVTKKEDGLSYAEKIDKLIASGNVDAIMVKFADMTHNTDPKRLAALPPDKQTYFREKYTGPYKKLQEAIGKLAAAGALPVTAQRPVPHVESASPILQET
jgi:hypothetical protein